MCTLFEHIGLKSHKDLYIRLVIDVHKTRVNVPVYLVLRCRICVAGKLDGQFYAMRVRIGGRVY